MAALCTLLFRPCVLFQSHFGIGTDVYITLNHIGDQEEALYYEERPELRLERKNG